MLNVVELGHEFFKIITIDCTVGIPLFLAIYARIYLEISLMSMNEGQWLNKLLFINISEYYTVIKNEEICMS